MSKRTSGSPVDPAHTPVDVAMSSRSALRRKGDRQEGGRWRGAAFRHILVGHFPVISLPPALVSFRVRDFRLFWGGQAMSAIGTWMQSIGQAWLVLQLSHSALQLGLTGALQALPVLLLTLPISTLADRWPRRRLLLITNTGALVQSVLLWSLVATGAIRLWHIYLLALALGLSNTLDGPVRHSLVPSLVPRSLLPNAVALNSALASTARIIGPALGGVVLAAWGVSVLFALNAFSYLPILLALLLIRLVGSTEPASGADRPRVADGLHYVWHTPLLLWAISIMGGLLFLGSNFNVVLPLFATSILHMGPTGFGLLSAFGGAGSIIAGVVLAWTHARPTRRRLLAAMGLFTALEGTFALSRLPLLSMLLIAAVSACEEVFATLTVTLVQSTVPDYLRGRISGVYILVFNGSVPAGYLLTGWLAATFGPSPGLLLLVAGCGAVLAGGWIWGTITREWTP